MNQAGLLFDLEVDISQFVSHQAISFALFYKFFKDNECDREIQTKAQNYKTNLEKKKNEIISFESCFCFHSKVTCCICSKVYNYTSNTGASNLLTRIELLKGFLEPFHQAAKELQARNTCTDHLVVLRRDERSCLTKWKLAHCYWRKWRSRVEITWTQNHNDCTDGSSEDDQF